MLMAVFSVTTKVATSMLLLIVSINLAHAKLISRAASSDSTIVDEPFISLVIDSSEIFDGNRIRSEDTRFDGFTPNYTVISTYGAFAAVPITDCGVIEEPVDPLFYPSGYQAKCSYEFNLGEQLVFESLNPAFLDSPYMDIQYVWTVTKHSGGGTVSQEITPVPDGLVAAVFDPNAYGDFFTVGEYNVEIKLVATLTGLDGMDAFASARDIYQEADGTTSYILLGRGGNARFTTTSFIGGNTRLTIVAADVPAPSAFSVLLVGLGALLFRRRATRRLSPLHNPSV
jgi:hypothetical protein